MISCSLPTESSGSGYSLAFSSYTSNVPQLAEDVTADSTVTLTFQYDLANVVYQTTVDVKQSAFQLASSILATVVSLLSVFAALFMYSVHVLRKLQWTILPLPVNVHLIDPEEAKAEEAAQRKRQAKSRRAVTDKKSLADDENSSNDIEDGLPGAPQFIEPRSAVDAAQRPALLSVTPDIATSEGTKGVMTVDPNLTHILQLTNDGQRNRSLDLASSLSSSSSSSPSPSAPGPATATRSPLNRNSADTPTDKRASLTHRTSTDTTAQEQMSQQHAPPVGIQMSPILDGQGPTSSQAWAAPAASSLDHSPVEAYSMLSSPSGNVGSI